MHVLSLLPPSPFPAILSLSALVLYLMVTSGGYMSQPQASTVSRGKRRKGTPVDFRLHPFRGATCIQRCVCWGRALKLSTWSLLVLHQASWWHLLWGIFRHSPGSNLSRGLLLSFCLPPPDMGHTPLCLNFLWVKYSHEANQLNGQFRTSRVFIKFVGMAPRQPLTILKHYVSSL